VELNTYVEQVRSQLASAAALGDDRTRQTADALSTAAEPAVRLAVLAAVTAAADEITAALLDQPGAYVVSVRLDGDELRVDVRGDVEPVAPTPSEDADPTARISLRLSDALKADIEVAARAGAISVNTWLVRSAMRALNADTARPNDNQAHGAARNAHSGHRITGWING
jgi:hypothetical protein